jgi:hypothetical protein
LTTINHGCFLEQLNLRKAMVAQGSGGAFEVSQRMTALLGWGGTTKFAEAWLVWGRNGDF